MNEYIEKEFLDLFEIKEKYLKGNEASAKEIERIFRFVQAFENAYKSYLFPTYVYPTLFFEQKVLKEYRTLSDLEQDDKAVITDDYNAYNHYGDIS